MNLDDTKAALEALDADVAEPDPDFLRAQEKAGETARIVRRALVVLVTDSGDDPQGNGSLVSELLAEANFMVDAVITVESRKSQIRNALETAVIGGADLVVTVGGTGVGPRDKAPDATRSVLDMILPGIAQALRASGIACGALDAGTSRGIAGISASTVIVNLASSRLAIRDGMAALVPLVHHVIDQL